MISYLITNSPLVSALFTDEIEVVQGGVNYGATFSQYITLLEGQALTWTGSHVWTTSTTPIVITQGIATTGSPTAFTLTAGAHTTLTAGTEAIPYLVDLSATCQFSTGAIATQRGMVIKPQTLAFVGASMVTTAVTLDVSSPIAGTNATLTNSYAGRFTASAAGHTPLVLKLAATPTGNAFEIRTSINTLPFFVDNLYNLSLISPAGVLFYSSSTSNPITVAQGASNALTITNGSGNVHVCIATTVAAATSRLTVNSNTTTDSVASVQLNSANTNEKVLVIQGIASRTAPLIQLQTSAGASLGNVGGCIADHYATVSSSSTSGAFDTIYSDTTVANTLAINGDKITFDYTLTIVSSATATREIKLAFGGITIFDSTALTFAAAGTVRITGYIQRVTSTTCRAVVRFDPSGSATILGFALTTYTSDGTLTGLTLSGTNILLLSAAAAGTGAAAADISGVLGTVSCIPSS
jgi:hypothetical protein